MFRRLTFTILFYSIFILTAFAQQVSILKKGAVGDAHGFQQDGAGNFYAIMPLYSGTKFYGTTVVPPIPSKKYKILGKFDSNFNLIWAKPFRWDYTTYTETVRDKIAIDQTGNIYLAEEDTTYKFTSAGNLIWKKGFTGHTIKLNKQGQLELYRFKNATNTLNGNPILNKDGTVVTMDTAGNYMRHFTLHSSAYQGQIVWGRNNAGYYGLRTGRHNIRGIYPQEVFICDSVGNTLQSKVLSYTNYNSIGNIKEFIFDPFYQKYYLAGTFRDLVPINKPDSTTNVGLRANLVQLNANLQINGVLNLGPAKNSGGIFYNFNLKAHRGSLFFTSKIISWTPNDRLFTHLGILNYQNSPNGKIILGKIDRNLNPVWVIEHGNPIGGNFMEYPIPTDDGIFYNGHTNSFSNQYITFNTTYASEEDTFIMKITDTDSTSAELSGTVFKDLNQNGLNDNEPGIPSQVIRNMALTSIHYSSLEGTFKTTAVTGQNKLFSGSLPPYWARSTPDSLVVNVPASSAQLSGFNFGMYPVPGVKDASVSLTPMTAARINMPVMHQVKYINNGTDNLSGKVKVVKAPELTFQNATITPTTVSGDTLIWNYTNLAPNEIRRIRINYTLPNNQAIVGNNLLNSANITPLAGDTAKANNTAEFYHRITGPLDPNDITVTPSCPITPAFISNKEYLEYRIRFQNIGTDTAFSVVIKDTLSTNFDLTSLEFSDQSHNAKISLKDNVLILFFENIKLPHSAVNYLGCHGFFTYRVKVKPNTSIGASIKNKAAIFFDYNAPVITNQVTTSVTATQIPFTTTIQNLLCHKANNGGISIDNTCSTAPVRYSLDSVNFQSMPVFSNLAAGTYSIWIKTGNKQYKLAPLQIQQPDSISATITLQHAAFGNGSINVLATGGTGSYKYILNSGTPQNTGYFNNLAAGTYQVSIKDNNNCVKTYTVVIQNISGTKDDLVAGFRIYPNPFTNTVQLETDKLPDTPIEIYNALGQLVYTREIKTKQTTLELKDLAAGVYLLKVNTTKGYSMQKIIKE